MKFQLYHNNINVFDLVKSIKFYEEAFDLKEVRRVTDDIRSNSHGFATATSLTI